MVLKFILSICVLMHLIGHVASVDVEDCMGFVESFPEEAKGFAEVDATQVELEVAIESIAKDELDSLGNISEGYRAHVKAEIRSQLTQCFDIRKVNYY